MCTGRVDIAFIMRAFKNGADGVFIGGCWPGECHYVTEGNFDALGNMHLSRMLLKKIGINPDRLRLEWISASEGSRYAEVMNDFGKKLKEMGPLGVGEGLDPEMLELKMDAVNKLAPYVKLVERERLRVPVKKEELYKEFFESEEVQKLFNELVVDKLEMSEILLLLRNHPMTTAEIGEKLQMAAGDVSKHLKAASRRGLAAYDETIKRYALVPAA